MTVARPLAHINITYIIYQKLCELACTGFPHETCKVVAHASYRAYSFEASKIPVTYTYNTYTQIYIAPKIVRTNLRCCYDHSRATKSVYLSFHQLRQNCAKLLDFFY